MKDWITILWFTNAFLLLFVAMDQLYYRNLLKAEHSRNLVHIGSGALALLFPFFFDEIFPVAILCTSFLGLLLLTKKLGLLGSVNAVKRKTYGSILYPIIVLVAYLFYLFKQNRSISEIDTRIYYCLPIAILAFCDPAAALIGKYFNQRHLKKKTWHGSLAFFIMAMIICILFWNLATRFTSQVDVFLLSLLVAIPCTAAEYFSQKGWDNFTIPLAGMLVLLGIS